MARTVKEFLVQYRAQGLPGAKRFRRQERLVVANLRHEADIAFIKRLTELSRTLYQALSVFADSSNWAIEENEGGKFIMWVGENEEPQKFALASIEKIGSEVKNV